jgi:hypothetical protein
VTAQGFQTKTLKGITLQVDQTASLTIVLAIGSISQSVEVTGSAPLVDTTTSSLGQVIDNHEVLSMPLNGRNPFALGLLVGNTAPVSGMATNLPFIGGGGEFTTNDVSLSGIDDNTFATAGNIGRQGIAIIPSVDAVEEFKVMTNNFAAEYGHAAGYIVAATIKAGSNQFHGALFEFLRNDDFDANNFFTNRAGLPRTPFHQNQFGGTLGGPIRRDRVFFFGDYQGTRETTQSGKSISSVPTAALASGDFSGQSAPIFDPRTRHIGPNGTVIATKFPGNKIDPTLINKTSAAILALLPAPNYGPPGAISGNYFYAPTSFSNTDQGDARVDASLTAKDHLIGTYSFSNNSQPSIGSFPGWIGGGTSSIDNNDQATISEVHIFTPSLVNDVRVGYLYNNSTQTGVGQLGASTANQIGLALLPSTPLGFPTIEMNYTALSNNASTEFTAFGGGSPEFNTLQTQQLADDVSWNRGRHSVKFGVDIRKSLFEVLKASFGSTIFASTFSSSSDTPNSGFPLADFLMGYPSNIIPGSAMIDKGRQREAYFGGYVQDDWKFSPKLTVNAGIRYELFTQPIDQTNLGSLFDITTGDFAIPGRSPYSRAMVNGDHSDWGPRIGLAYQISPKFVVRSGYGIFYAMRAQGQNATQFSGNSPNIPTLVLPIVTPQSSITPPYTINTPIPVVPGVDSLAGFTATKPYGSGIKTQSLQRGFMPRLMQYNLDLQYQINRTLLFEASYSGAKGDHFTSSNIDENQEPFGDAINGTNNQTHRPFPNVSTTVLTLFSTASSNYNALNVKVQDQMGHGLEFLANYSWQKNLLENGDGPSSFNQTGTSVLMNTYDPRASYGVSDINIAQTVTASALYELPFGSGKHFLNIKGPANAFLGGWIVNGILSIRTGFPSDVHTTALPPVFASFNVASCVPGVSKVLSNHSVDGYYNPAAFTVPLDATTSSGAQVPEYGNCAKNVITGPSSKNLDSSLFKNFYFTDSHRVYLQFRAEAFNTTNTPTFYLPAASDPTLSCKGNPGAICNSGNASFGQLVNGSASGRQIQFAAKLYY